MSKALLKRLSLGVVFAFVIGGLGVGTVSAHVTVKPGEVTTASYQTFTVNVPNEKEISTTSVEVLVPAGVTGVTPTQKAGWVIATEKDGDNVSSITWSEGEVKTGLRDEFTFSAKTPSEAGDLKWKAYQTYSDGTVVSWDQDGDGHSGHDEGEENKGPLSVTSVVVKPAAEVENSEAIDQAKVAAQRSLYVAVASVVIALISIYFATRKKS